MPVISPQEEISVSEPKLRLNADDATSERRVIVWTWVAVAIFGFLQAVVGRFYMNPDGISYADLADSYIRGEWHAAVSAYWSPLYPLLLSITFRLFHPTPYFEAAVIHLLNFLLYLCCFAALQLFIFEIAHDRVLPFAARQELRFSRPALLALGAAGFLLATQYYLPLFLVTPDLCVVALGLLSAFVILRMERLGTTHHRLIALGVILGTGYLAKAAFFPVAFVFMGTALARKTPWSTILKRTAVLLLAFLTIAGPNIFAISSIKRSLTFADTGRLNYLWFVNGTSSTNFEVHGQAQGTPTHQTRKIFADPNVYEFATPIKGTYPVWFDPSYWNDGLHPKFDIEQQLNAIGSTSRAYVLMFSSLNWLYFALLVLGILQHTSGFSCFTSIREYWRIAIPALAALAVYCPVYVEGRYVAGFLLILLIVLFVSIRLPIHLLSERILQAVSVGLVIAAGVALCPQLRSNIEASTYPLPNEHWNVAKALHQEFELHDGDSVGCIDNCFYSYWARLGKFRIVTEVPTEQTHVFRRSDRSTQLAALNAMARVGAKVVVTRQFFGPGWKQIGQTEYFAYDLRSLVTNTDTR